MGKITTPNIGISNFYTNCPAINTYNHTCNITVSTSCSVTIINFTMQKWNAARFQVKLAF